MGQYQITQLLGEGGMSQVFKAIDVHLGREVALKVLHQSLSRDSALTAMFEREAKLTASILHPNVVKVYTVGNEDGYFFIAMELVEATSLEQMITASGALSEKDVLHVAHDVVAGLKAAHHEGLIHRDIKPGNMLVTEEGTSKLVDFGLAVQQGGDDESEDLWATPHYVPPEKLDGEIDTYLGDIYSLGATLHHALTGKPPFEANTSSMEELKQIKTADLNLKAEAPASSKATVKLIERMMAYRPEARPQSYDFLLAEIIDIEKKTFGVDRNKSRSSRTNQKIPWLMAGAFSGLLAVAAVLWLSLKENKPSSKADDFTVGADEGGIISAGAESNAAQFLKGRELLVKGEFRKALNIFSELTGASSLSPSTQMWSHFFAGTLQLFLGEEADSRAYFANISSIDPANEEGVGDVVAFLQRASDLLASDLPLMESTILFEADAVDSVGLLGAGLKNWQLGNFESGIALLEEFASSQPPEGFVWINELKPSVEVFRRDYKLLKELPSPARKNGVDSLQSDRKSLTAAIDEIETRGSLPRLITSRLKRIDEIGALITEEREVVDNPQAVTVMEQPDLGIPEVTPEAGVVDPFAEQKMSDEELLEREQLRELLFSLKDYSASYQFSEAIDKLQSEPFKSWAIQGVRNEFVLGFGRAEGFLRMLADQLTDSSYEGVIRRKEGVPLEAVITFADPSVFVVDLGFGPNEVRVSEFAPDWLVEAAEGLLPPFTPATQEAWENVLFFALATGQNEPVSRISEVIRAGSPEFEERWGKLTLLSAPSP
jgi:serine/threonine protein kinase